MFYTFDTNVGLFNQADMEINTYFGGLHAGYQTGLKTGTMGPKDPVQGLKMIIFIFYLACWNLKSYFCTRL